jgi:hypothetical protein
VSCAWASAVAAEAMAKSDAIVARSIRDPPI